MNSLRPSLKQHAQNLQVSVPNGVVELKEVDTCPNPHPEAIFIWWLENENFRFRQEIISGKTSYMTNRKWTSGIFEGSLSHNVSWLYCKIYFIFYFICIFYPPSPLVIHNSFQCSVFMWFLGVQMNGSLQQSLSLVPFLVLFSFSLLALSCPNVLVLSYHIILYFIFIV